MSCDASSRKAHNHFNGPGSAGAVAFGSTEAAIMAMEQITEVARNQARRKMRLLDEQGTEEAKRLFAAQQNQATQKTAKLFRMWQQALGSDFRVPAHGETNDKLGVALPEDLGMHFGYAAVYDTQQALNGKGNMPSIAKQVMEAGQRRQIKATGPDRHGKNRCSQCGQYASLTKTHNCPLTASVQSMAKALGKRLKVPPSSYNGTGQARLMMQFMLDEARHAGTVLMRHGVTGEKIAATLDGALLALQQGYSPEVWGSGTNGALAITPDNRVIRVLNLGKLTEYQLTGGAVEQAAAAYGSVFPAGVPLASNISTTPPLTTAGSTNVQGGTTYNEGRFVGSLFRKKAARGGVIEADGKIYRIGEKLPDSQEHWGAARRASVVTAPPNGLVVGRAVVEAAELLRTAQINETDEGVLEIYNSDKSALLAAYDPRTGSAGDVNGTDNLSAEQLAAVIMYRARDNQNSLDKYLSQDVAALRSGNGMATAVADSAYCSIRRDLADGKTIAFGGNLGSQKCPDCGQFMGTQHNCPYGITNPPVNAPSIPVDNQISTDNAAKSINQLDPGSVTAPISATETVELPIAGAATDEKPVTAVVQAPAIGANTVVVPESIDLQLPVPNPVMDTTATAAIERLANTLERLLESRFATPAADPAAAPYPGIDTNNDAPIKSSPAMLREQIARRAARKPLERPVRPTTDVMPMTMQEHIMGHVKPPAEADAYLSNLPSRIGGDLNQALDLEIPAIDPNFEVDESTEKALRLMSAALQLAWNPDNAQPQSQYASFGLYGPPGTGKNTTARQMAAVLGLPYVETTINPDTSAQDEIGRTILEDGSTRAQLGKLGLAAAAGSVICVNEIVRNPRMATAFQGMMEDRYIEIQGTEGGIQRIPVHPSTVFVMTWNPGLEGDDDRPAGAPLARMMPIELKRPTTDEQAERLMADFYRMSGKTGDVTGTGARREQRRQEILQRDYKNKPIEPTMDRCKAAARFMNDVQALAKEGQLAIGGSNVSPGPRETRRFMYIIESTGDPELALEQLKIYCDQDPSSFETQWGSVMEVYRNVYGHDGQALFSPSVIPNPS